VTIPILSDLTGSGPPFLVPHSSPARTADALVLSPALWQNSIPYRRLGSSGRFVVLCDLPELSIWGGSLAPEMAPPMIGDVDA
jgi:hypothetical protein